MSKPLTVDANKLKILDKEKEYEGLLKMRGWNYTSRLLVVKLKELKFI